MPVAPFVGEISDGGEPPVEPLTFVVTEAELFDDFGSGVCAATVAVAVMGPGVCGAIAVMVIGAFVPCGDDCALHCALEPLLLQLQPAPFAPTNVEPFGRRTLMIGLVAEVGPLFVTCTV